MSRLNGMQIHAKRLSETGFGYHLGRPKGKGATTKD